MPRPRTPIDAICLALMLAVRVMTGADVPEITGFEALIQAGKYVEVSPALQTYVATAIRNHGNLVINSAM